MKTRTACEYVRMFSLALLIISHYVIRALEKSEIVSQMDPRLSQVSLDVKDSTPDYGGLWHTLLCCVSMTVLSS